MPSCGKNLPEVLETIRKKSFKANEAKRSSTQKHQAQAPLLKTWYLSLLVMKQWILAFNKKAIGLIKIK